MQTATAEPVTTLKSWQAIIESEIEPPQSIVESLIEEGGISLLIARQKEGKSMLAAQLSIDVSFGEKFLGQLATRQGRVVYIDYENRTHRLKKRGEELGSGRKITDVFFAAYDRIADRNLGLDGEDLKRLMAAVDEHKPSLLVIDPLRLATSMDLVDAGKVVGVLENASMIQRNNPWLGIVLVHHLKKLQGDGTVSLRSNPRDWVDRAFGSQALLAHVETIIGLEQDEDRQYTLATVPRSYEPLTWALEAHGMTLEQKLSAWRKCGTIGHHCVLIPRTAVISILYNPDQRDTGDEHLQLLNNLASPAKPN
jgi:hypothetical protein